MRRVLLLCLLLIGFAVSVQAQSDGVLVFGQPAVGEISAEQPTVTFEYVVTEDRQVVLEAFGDGVQPTITIRRNGETVAEQLNTEGAFTVSLSALVSAGTYMVEVGAADGAEGIVVLLLENETVFTPIPLAEGILMTGQVNESAATAMYTFNALTSPAYLYIVQQAGANIRLINTTTNTISAVVGIDIESARLRITPNNAAYRLEVMQNEAGGEQTFTLCLEAVGAGTCEVQPVVAPVATEEALPVPVATCTVSPVNAGGANIRQSASLNAIVLGALPSGAFADVIGIAPDRSFYNVLYDGINGWIASSAVSAAGNCDNAPIVQPPQVVPLPLTATPIPPSPVPPMPTATQSGPCLIRMTGEALIYTQPTAGESNIYDEVQPGYELIPVGRLADNSWWQTNYAGAWIQTNLFGSVAQVSGNCSALPIVSP